jgi:hypothetical protein
MEEVKTNLNKTNCEIIYELLIALTKGNCSYRGSSRLGEAYHQYNQLLRNGVVKEL